MEKEIEINDDFRKAIQLVEEREENVFITGRAGTGKSTFLGYFTGMTKKHAVVLAPTGVAAVNVGGQTIHSFFAIPPGATPEETREEALRRENTEIFKKAELVIIDEVSMVRADLLDCIDVYLKTVLDSRKPFGGKQMLFIGDLYQLPPVVKSNEEKRLFMEHYASQYFFDADAMKGFRYTLVEFHKIYRQSDTKFIELLNRIRNKTATEEDMEKINSRLEAEPSDDGYIHLTTTNKMAEDINTKKLAAIHEKQYDFKARTEGDFDKDSFPAETLLRLKKGAQVMFVANDSGRKWVNGTLGIITKIAKNEVKARLLSGRQVKVYRHTWEIFRYRYSPSTGIEKETIGTFTQYPLRLAWAITIHKSQGKTFEKVIIDVGKGTFATGQIYVALSRCTTLEGIKIKTPIRKHHIFTDWKIPKFLTKIQYEQANQSFKGDKRQIIQKAIREKKAITITYLKPSDEKSTRKITPLQIRKMEYMGYEFEGLEAYCHAKKDKRNFKIDRILEIADIENELPH